MTVKVIYVTGGLITIKLSFKSAIKNYQTNIIHSYLLSLNGQTPEVIDGFTGEQRIFVGWSQVWRSKDRDEALRNKLMTDSHFPGKYRVFGTPRNIEAFDVKPGDKMYL